MKNIKFIFAALVSLAALSCQKESLPQSTPEVDSEANKIPLVLKVGEETKTSLQSDGSIHWTMGDTLAVFDNSATGDNNNRFTATYVNGSSAEFSGSVGITTTRIGAVYPYKLAVSCELPSILDVFNTGCKFKVNVPKDQIAKAGTFADAHNISVSKASVTQGQVDDATISFKNVCTLLSFTLPENLPAKIEKVTLSSASAIAGVMDVDYKNDTPSCSMPSDQLKQITMTGTFAAEQTYWFVVAPGTLKGLSIAVHASNGIVYTKTINSDILLTQGTYRSLGTLVFDKMTSPEISAEHTYGESNVLTGTKLAVRLPHANVTEVDLTVTKGGTSVRNIESLPSADTGVITSGIDNGWPYLPKGEYILSGSYTTSDKGTINVNVPFKVTETPSARSITAFDVYTSYTNKDNELNGKSIYVKLKVNVEDDILKGAQYSGLFSYNLNDLTSYVSPNANGMLVGEIANQTVGKYDFTSVSCSFDGSINNETRSISQTVHVTGIPARITLYDNETNVKNSGWFFSNVTWSNSKCCISYNGSDGNLISPEFYVPESTEVAYSTTVQYYVAFTSGSAANYSCDLRVGVTSSNQTVATTYQAYTITGDNSTRQNFVTRSDKLSINGTSYISFHHNKPSQPKYTIGSGWFSTTVKAEWWYLNLGAIEITYYQGKPSSR